MITVKRNARNIILWGCEMSRGMETEETVDENCVVFVVYHASSLTMSESHRSYSCQADCPQKALCIGNESVHLIHKNV
jgi:hypothetical protein